MLRLRTFGGVYVASADGEPLSGAAGQRRLLALLSALAVAGDGGLSRDKLVGLLWPETDEERARHSLTQALYAARRALDADDLFIVAADIRLNRARLTSDVQELELAVDAGDLERVAALYQGPFLDGFYLPASVAFEQWATLQRDRFEDRAAGALERLAERAEAEDDLRGAVEWRKRLAAVRPLDSAVAVRLMAALAQAGDRAGALQHARLHEVLLREQLGLDVDPAVTTLAARLRDGSVWSPLEAGARDRVLAGAGVAAAGELAADESMAIDEPRVALAPPASALPMPTVPPAIDAVDPFGAAPAPAPATPLAPIRRPRRRVGWLIAAAAVAVAALTLAPWARRAPAPAATPQLRQKVVVAPFRVAGASETLAYLRDGMVELLSTRLADDSAARSVDAGAVIGAWRAAGLAGSVDVPRDTVVRLAARLGAERVVVGSVVGTPRHAVVNAAVVAVPSGRVTGQATVEGPADSITALVDRLAAKLLVLDAGEDVSLAGQTTASLSALRAFLDGQAAFRTAGYAAALRQYERALQLDSTFALAGLQLVRAADRLHTAEGRDRALAIAWRNREALSDRDGALLVAIAGPEYPAPSAAAEQLAAWNRLVDLTPDRADAWHELGTRLFHDGAVLGVASWRARAASALHRALSLDSGYAAARNLAAHLASAAPDGAAAPGAASLDSAGPLAPFLRWRAAVARDDAAALRRLRDTLPRLGRANLRAIALASQFDGVALEDGRRALRLLRERGGRRAERLEAAEGEHGMALNEGRLRDAVAATDRLEELQPGARAHLRLRVLDAIHGDGPPAVAAAAAAELERLAAARPGAPGAHAVRLADACVLAQWRLSRGDTAGVASTVDALRAERGLGERPPVAAAPAACALLVDAWLGVVLRRPDAAGAVRRADSLAFTPAAAGDASAYAALLVARLHERLGEPRRALDAVRRRPYMAGWPRYLATMLREEGRYATLAGAASVADAARRQYDAFRGDGGGGR